MGDITTPIIFILIGVITSYYNKNMLVILFISLVFSNILKYGSNLAIINEGFSEGMKDPIKDNINDKNVDKLIDQDVEQIVEPESNSTEPNKKIQDIKNMKDKITGLINTLQTYIHKEKCTRLFKKTIRTKIYYWKYI